MFIKYKHIIKLQEEITMKILIVDDQAELKCSGIIKECEKRGVEVEIAKVRNSALLRIILQKQDIDGIVLDMGIPIYDDEFTEDEREGDDVLRELHRKKYKIPVLIFSTTDSFYKDQCDFVVDQMTSWNIIQEEDKFFSFLEKIERKQ